MRELQHVVDGDRVLHRRARIFGRPFALDNGDHRELLLADAVVLHVAQHRDGEGRGRAGDAERHLELTLQAGAITGKSADADARAAAFAVGDEDGIAQPLVDRRRGVAHVQHERASAHHRAVHPGRGDAEITGQVRRPFGRGGEAVDVGGFSPASAIALSAASAWSWICERLGIRPSSVVSAAPTTAIDFRFMSGTCRFEEGEGDLVGLFFEHHFQGHVELQGLGRLRAFDDVGHHARPFGEFHDRDRIGRREARRGPMVDDVAVEYRAAAGLEDRHLARGAFGTERPRRKICVAAFVAALQTQFAGGGSFPKMDGLRRRFG